jgi:hypothetical protein
MVAVISFAAGVAYAQETESEQVKVDGAFRATWLRPDVDITKYSKLYPWQARYEFREEVDTQDATTATDKLRGGGGPYSIREQSKQKFEEVVNAAFVQELGRSKIFEIVDQVGPGTLLVRASVLDIVSNVPPNYDEVEINLSSVGEATFIFELIDAETGQVLATGGERRTIQRPTSRTVGVGPVSSSAADVWAKVEQWATEAAKDLRKALETAHKKASK